MQAAAWADRGIIYAPSPEKNGLNGWMLIEQEKDWMVEREVAGSLVVNTSSLQISIKRDAKTLY